MVAKLRGKFLPKDFHISLFKQMQNMKQRVMTVKEYIEEFYKINLMAGYIEDTIEKVAIYLNGLRYDIQDELSLVNPIDIGESYQYALRAEERIQRRQTTRVNYSTRGRGGQSSGKGKSISQLVGASNSTQQRQFDNDSRGGRNTSRSGRGRNGGRGATYHCYKCNKLGHRSFECLDNEESRH